MWKRVHSRIWSPSTGTDLQEKPLLTPTSPTADHYQLAGPYQKRPHSIEALLVSEGWPLCTGQSANVGHKGFHPQKPARKCPPTTASRPPRNGEMQTPCKGNGLLVRYLQGSGSTSVILHCMPETPKLKTPGATDQHGGPSKALSFTHGSCFPFAFLLHFFVYINYSQGWCYLLPIILCLTLTCLFCSLVAMSVRLRTATVERLKGQSPWDLGLQR